MHAGHACAYDYVISNQKSSMDTQAHRAQLNNLWAAFQEGMADSENSWHVLPDRLRGRGDWLKQRGRIKDAELMYDAASEIESLRGLMR